MNNEITEILKEYLLKFNFKYVFALHNGKFFNYYMSNECRECIKLLKDINLPHTIEPENHSEYIVSIDIEDVYKHYIQSRRDENIDIILNER
jgi:hypothetical protein